jgi:16S rRNA (cytidine1402-2'-O)-methyltransferase
MEKGMIYMIPVTLGGEVVNDVVPANVQSIATELRYFIVENVKSARRFLRKVDRQFPIDDCQFFEINRKTEASEIHRFLKPAKEGHNIGVMSDAGCPGVADPGAIIMTLAHEKNIKVQPLVGPSSILLTLMGSGFNGQDFTFTGYLPKDRKARIRQLKDFEADTYRNGTTHLFMDTPFRNMNVLDDLLNELADSTMICIASNLTLPSENIRTMSAKDWREHAYDLAKKPTMFAIGKKQ